MSDNTTPDGPSPWTRPSFITAALVVGVIVVLGIIVGITALSRDNNQSPAPTALPSKSAVPSQGNDVAGFASVCGLDGVELSGTVDAPPAVEWSLVGTTAVPRSSVAGPGAVSEGFRHCFQHTPRGALLAAANYFAMGTQPDLARLMLERGVLHGPGRDAALAAADSASSEPSPGDVRVQITGFRVATYAGKSASVDIAFRSSMGVNAAWLYQLQWANGDWKLVFAANGQMPTTPTRIANLVGYIPWGGA